MNFLEKPPGLDHVPALLGEEVLSEGHLIDLVEAHAPGVAEGIHALLANKLDRPVEEIAIPQAAKHKQT